MTVHRGSRPSARDGPDAPADATGVVGPGPARSEPVRSVPEATVARLAVYLRELTELLAAGRGTVSSEELAAAAGVNSAKLRKDLSHIGSSGVRGVGYDVARLIAQVESTLGLTHAHAVALVGVGNLGQALAGYGGFADRGFPVIALFDVDPAIVGRAVPGSASAAGEVLHASRLGTVCRERGITIGVVATPAAAAQQVCDELVAAGVVSILNFAPAVLSVPEGVEVRKVDLAGEMQVLSFHLARRRGTVPAGLDDVPEARGRAVRR